jgi:hypothetical protein
MDGGSYGMQLGRLFTFSVLPGPFSVVRVNSVPTCITENGQRKAANVPSMVVELGKGA